GQPAARAPSVIVCSIHYLSDLITLGISRFTVGGLLEIQRQRHRLTGTLQGQLHPRAVVELLHQLAKPGSIGKRDPVHLGNDIVWPQSCATEEGSLLAGLQTVALKLATFHLRTGIN